MAPLFEIFYFIDDFCKHFQGKINQRILPNPNRKRNRLSALSLSEIMTITVMFHLSSYRTFKDFYVNYVCVYWKNEFPNLVSYNRFLELMPNAFMPLLVLMNYCCGQKTGRYYIDSTKLTVCDNLRIYRHKVFKDIAKRGKTSTGWFFGFKLHLVINQLGEIVKFAITPGNVDDRSVVMKLSDGLKGWLFGDKGYLSKDMKDSLFAKGIELFTSMRKNMKQLKISKLQKAFLRKRGIIETIIDQLKSICHLQHTRHRSTSNFLVNLISGLLAYTFKPSKPSVSFHNSTSSFPSLMSS